MALAMKPTATQRPAALRRHSKARCGIPAVKLALISAAITFLIHWPQLVTAQRPPAAGNGPLKLSQLPQYAAYTAAQRRRGQTLQLGRVKDVRWATDGGHVVFTADGKRQQLNLQTGRLQRVTVAPTAASANQTLSSPARSGVPRAQQRRSELSPDGSFTAIYKDFNVSIRDQKTMKMRAVTTAGTDRVRFGTGCWVYGEELEQDTAMWWSPDSRKLAFYQVDERDMRDYVLTTDNTQRYTRTQVVRYPKAGDPNPVVGLLVYDRVSQITTGINVSGPNGEYIFNVRFSPLGDELIYSRLNRLQNRLDVVAVNVTSGQSRIVVSETQPTFQNPRPLMRMLDDGDRFIWETERTGWKNFELRSLQGNPLVELTEFSDFPCDEIHLVDQDAGLMYYSAFSDANPYNRQLHRCRLDGTHQTPITAAGLNHHSFLVSPDHRWVIAQGERFDAPPKTVLYAINDGNPATLPAVFENGITLTSPVAQTTAGENNEIFKFLADDGVTEIFGTLQKPSNFDPAKRYPLLIDVYGGPQSVGIDNRFTSTDPVCELGFLVAKIGNRGTIDRGKAFESATYKNLGGADLDDQAAGVRFLANRPYVDRGAVGIFGHSYGGYLTALAVLKYPQTFHVGVAGAPVTDWKNYDTIYTERYLQQPKENPAGYRSSSCLTYADRIEGKLLLVHGLIDDNVHPANTWQLIQRLQKNDQRFDLMIYPRFKHGIGSNYPQLRLEYLVEHLKK